MKKSVTMQDVADYCGCSRATISRVLNNDKSVTPDTHKLVYDAIKNWIIILIQWPERFLAVNPRL